LLETVINYDVNMTMEKTLLALGHSSYDDYFKLVDAILDGNTRMLVSTIDKMHNDGVDLKRFVDLFTDFCFDLVKYIICGNIQVTKIPGHYIDQLNHVTQFNESIKYFNYIVDKLLLLKNMIKTDSNEKITIQIMFNQISRFV